MKIFLQNDCCGAYDSSKNIWSWSEVIFAAEDMLYDFVIK